jgi:hypothetical protein
MVSVPAVNPSDAVAVTVRLAVAVLPDPSVTWLTLPMVTPPVVKVTGPVSVPGVVPLTVALNVTLLPKGKDVGDAETEVVVGWLPDATTFRIRPVEVEPR